MRRRLMAPFVLFLLVFLLFITNYSPNTVLSGWDNLHPEFNFALNLKRSIFSVWQEYQGLGLLGGMGHAADLPRQILLWLSSIVLPVSLIRYFYHFAMLFFGACGLYLLLEKIIFAQEENRIKRQIASLSGAVFYLFNLATLQMFYVPFEVYSAHFAALPWLFWGFLNFIQNGGRKNLFWFILVNLLFLAQAYVPTYFYVFLIALFLFSLFFVNKIIFFKRALLSFFLILVINSFWLLPNLYFVFRNSDINVNAKINQMATENNLLKSQKFGHLSEAILLRGFWFDNVEINQDGRSDYQFAPWRKHLEKPWVLILGYGLVGLAVLGLIMSFFKKDKILLAFSAVFLLSFSLLAQETPPFSYLAKAFYQIPLLKQIFRYSFTKFSLLTVFCLSLFYAYLLLLSIKLAKIKMISFLAAVLFLLLPIFYLYPVFMGQLFYFKEKAKIPQEYFQVMDFFKTQDENTRIANFPQNTFWGWSLYRWNYSGSGFLWYGIKQPILDRAFDVWNDKNENYYWEASYALYSKNLELLEKVFDKYQISWLLLDENIISPSSSKSLYLEELKELLANSKRFEPVQKFGKISLYRFGLEMPINNYVFMADNLSDISPVYKWNNFDQAYFDNGSYMTNSQFPLSNSQYYPFRSLFTGRSEEEREFTIEEQEDYFVFKKNLPTAWQNSQLVIPQETKELLEIDPLDLAKMVYLEPEVNFDSPNLVVKVPKVKGYYRADIDPSREEIFNKPQNCNPFGQGEVKNEIESDGFVRLFAQDAQNCTAVFPLDDLDHQRGYLITVSTRNILGKSLLFWLENLTNQKADIETFLPKGESRQKSFYLQPPMASDGLGYVLHFDNVSVSQESTINDLGKITVNQIPFRFLTGLKLVLPEAMNLNPQFFRPSNVEHPNPSLYKIQLPSTINHQSLTMVLSQSYDPGWQAYVTNQKLTGFLVPFFGQKIKDHVLVNNWENGWNLDSSTINHQPLTIYLVYLPQYLEYLGFGLLLLLFPSFFLLEKLLD